MKTTYERHAFAFDIRALENETGEKIITGRPIVYESKTDLLMYGQPSLREEVFICQ